MWGLTEEFMGVLEEGFREFLGEVRDHPGLDRMKAEFLIPEYIGKLLENDRIQVKVLDTGDKWFGVTYREDKPAVEAAFRRLIDQGVYDADLYRDLR